MKRLMVSAIGNRIYLTNVRQDKKKPSLFIATGEKQDYTDEAIRAVFEWFMNNCKDDNAYEIRYNGVPYVLSMKQEKEPAPFADGTSSKK